MVRLEGVSLRYREGPEVLHGIDLELEPGSFHFLLGPSGAGKSSLMRCIYMANKPTKGRVMLFGRDVQTLDRDEQALMRRRIGVVFQDFRLLPHLNAFENVALPLRLSGESSRALDSKVAELMRWVGLADCLEAYPATLSGGQQQRVAIARAVIGRPSLLVADEPTGNVDERLAMRLLFLFQELNRNGTTVFIATHNQALVQRFPYPFYRIDDGVLSQGRRGAASPAAAGAAGG